MNKGFYPPPRLGLRKARWIIICSLQLLLMFCYSNLSAQYCNLIADNAFDATTSTTGNSQFADGYVPNWDACEATPQIVSSGYSSPYCAQMFALYSTTSPGGEAIYQKITPLKPGRQYVLGMKNKLMPSQSGTGYIVAGFAHASDVVKIKAGLVAPDNAPMQKPLNAIPTTSWKSDNSCFTADSSYDVIVIYPVASSTYNVFWVHVDDVELYEVKPFAGKDTSICGSPAPIMLGKLACPTPSISFTQAFRWYTLSGTTLTPVSGITMSTTHPTVTPGLGKTKYVVERNIKGCSKDYDTVEICISPFPVVDLGSDTSLCGPACYTLNAPYGSHYTYQWSTGDSSQTIDACKSGKYWVNVFSECGCKGTDTVKVTIFPDIGINPHDTSICFQDFPYTLSVDAGYASYLWSVGATTSSINIDFPGDYWVTVTDINGCSRTDTAHIKIMDGATVDLGADKEACQGDTVQLCGPNNVNVTYSWSSGESTQCIKVTATGDYVLQISSISGCLASDTVHVTFQPIPVINSLAFGPYCLNHPGVDISLHSSDSESISGDGVDKTTFYPRGAGPGNHTITYTLTNTSGCSNTASINIIVYDAPIVNIDPVNPLCVNGDAVTIHASPPDGSFTGTTTDSTFDPKTAGAGWHTITYTATDDSSGCTDSDTIRIFVNTKANGYIVQLNTDACDAIGANLLAGNNGISPPNPNLYVYWLDNGSTNPLRTVFTTGTYTAVISDSTGACPDTVSIDISLASCCNKPPDFDTIGITSTTYWSDTTIVISREIRVYPAGSLILNNVNLVMLSCSQIIIEGGGSIIANNTKFGVCNEGWKGIEVWGWVDNCPDNYAGQGKFVGINCKFEHADIALFAGRRTTLPGLGDRRTFAGGVVQVDTCYFNDNFVDIMFTEWQVGELCFSTCPHCWQSHAYNNTFDNLRAIEQCYDDNGELFATITMPVYGLVQGHVVDFSLNEVIWTTGFCMPATCCNIPSPNDNTNFRADLANCTLGQLIFDHNTYMQGGAFSTPYIYTPVALPSIFITIPIYYY